MESKLTDFIFHKMGVPNGSEVPGSRVASSEADQREYREPVDPGLQGRRISTSRRSSIA